MSKCFGKNHPPECNCGYNPIYVNGNPSYNNKKLTTSYLKNNVVSSANVKFGNIALYSVSGKSFETKCQYCGKAIFFVRHNDGSVFFDSLGYPWPKHKCMLRNDESRKFNYFLLNFNQKSDRLCVIIKIKITIIFYWHQFVPTTFPHNFKNNQNI
jgi:hypothetical protein